VQYLIPILQGNFPNVETSEIVDIATESRGNLEAAKRIIEGHLSFHFCDFFFFFFFFLGMNCFQGMFPISERREKREKTSEGNAFSKMMTYAQGLESKCFISDLHLPNMP